MNKLRFMMENMHTYLSKMPHIGAMVAMLLVSACSSYEFTPHTGGLFAVRNSPVPVPRPRTKPQPPFHKREFVNKVAPRQAAPSGKQRVTVKKGDTVYGISRRFDIPVKDLIKLNRLKPPYVLSLGTKLLVPSRNYHTVQRGDTGTNIAKRYGVHVSALMRLNNIRKPFILSLGQKLKLPGGASNNSSKVAAAKGKSGRKSVTRGKNLAAPPRSGNGFSWPLKGKVVSRYGPKSEGQKNEGINIAAKLGAPVRAAQSGVVVYASNGIEGYGNLLLIKHSGGWMTTYAHNERILVTKGQTVARGQVIARVGKSGGVKIPQLHFEIRKGRLTYDPVKYLPK